MAIYRAPTSHYEHILKHWSNEHGTYDQTTMNQVIEAVAKFCEEALVETAQEGDQFGVQYDPKTKEVVVSQSFQDVYQTICDNGYASLALPTEYGGGGAPWMLHHMISEMLASSNLALSTCPLLTNGVIEVLIQAGSDELKKLFLPKMVQGVYSGTMCLTEPQCGTDLGLIQTTADPDGKHYQLTGTKIWITFGEHNLTENIVHLVLAKIPGGPEGVKGISLFLVPKFMPDGTKNGVSCGGVEEKMGQHGSPTCVINFDGAQGWLVGNEHEGMKTMFKMMNPARIGVGIQGLSMSEIAYQTALSFAQNRRQSRSLDPKLVDEKASSDLILVHPDVRRMLMSVEVTNYTMRLLVGYCGHCMDTNDSIVPLLTPIVKSYLSERGMQNVSVAMQSMGGSGYVKDWFCEQYYRDGRITMIYEGTNGIQALELVGRKIGKDGGKTLLTLIGLMEGSLKSLPAVQKARLTDCIQSLQAVNAYWLKHVSDPITVISGASDYLNLLATVIQYWLLCDVGLKDKSLDPALVAFYEDYILPEVDLYQARVLSGQSSLMDHEGHNQFIDQNKS